MLEIHLDPLGGIAGDMFVAAMLDFRPDLEPGLTKALALCPLIGDVTFDVAGHNDGILTGKRFIVRRQDNAAETTHDHHHDNDAVHRHERHHGHVHWSLIRGASRLDARRRDREARDRHLHRVGGGRGQGPRHRTRPCELR